MIKAIRSASKAILSALVLLGGCGKTNEEEKTILQKLQDLSVFITNEEWGTIASESGMGEEDIRNLIPEENCVFMNQMIPLGENGGYLLFQCEEKELVVSAFFSEKKKISELSSFFWPNAPETVSSEEFTEEIVYIGKSPRLYGVLTVPAGTDDASVAVLLPDGLDNNRDESNGTQKRKLLAHALAENGIASLRFDQRGGCDPSVLENGSLDRLIEEDLASAIHLLERYPVDAGDIYLVSLGRGCVFPYSAVYHHFEVTGGIVLVDPYPGDGLSVLSSFLGVDETEARQRVLQEDDEIFEYPFSYWQEWADLNPQRFVPYVHVPVLLLGEDTEYWQELLEGSSLTEKVYAGRTDEKQIARDIYRWMIGEDIQEEEEEKK